MYKWLEGRRKHRDAVYVTGGLPIPSTIFDDSSGFVVTFVASE